MIQEIKTFGEFAPFPAYKDRQGWKRMEEKRPREAAFFTAGAKKLLGQEWPSLPASLYMEFYRNGNRSHYQARFFKRRRNLFILLMAECLEGRGTYLDEIVNGLWFICEESNWLIPACLNQYPPDGPAKELPDMTAEHYVDLFAAETGSLLSWVYYFLANAIAAAAPRALRRLEWEMERRLLMPYLEHDDYWWMGLNHDQPVNNWNPWINSNMLVCFLIGAKYFPGSYAGAAKTIRSLNRYLAAYPEDGGCDEGPSYFTRAGSSLFDCIEELSHSTDVSYLYADVKIRNMAAYVYKVYIAQKYYVNYADASAMVSMPAGLVARIGEKIQDDTLVRFAEYLRQSQFTASGNDANASNFSVFRELSDLFTETGEADAETGGPPIFPKAGWFKDIQVITARDGEDAGRGFFFSAKGGHNAESHNHNDIGNFLLYYDGTPVVVDAGVEEYTKFTFNEARYSLWTMRSCYHNTPTINGVDQSPGREYRAEDVSFSDSGGTVKFFLEIAGAYPEAAALKSFRRELAFNRGDGLLVSDTYSLKEWKAPLVFNFLCYEKPALAGNVAVLSGGVVLQFDGSTLVPETETIPLMDHKIRTDWQKDSLYCLRLAKRDRELAGTVNLRFFRR
jgi:hypothetical protein